MHRQRGGCHTECPLGSLATSEPQVHMAALARRAVRSALALSALLLASATPCAAATADADGMEAEMARPDDALAASLTGDGFIAPEASHEAIPGRNQGPEKLTFLSTTLGSHMVLQRAPQQARPEHNPRPALCSPHS